MIFRLNDLVSTNASTLRKLSLELNSESTLKKGKDELTRSYSKVNVLFMNFEKPTGLWLTSDYCSNLRELKMMLVDFKITDKKLIRKTFQSLRNLECLKMSECDINDYENSMQNTIEAVEMVSIKHILLSSTHLAILLFLKTPNLISLKICNKSDLETPTIATTFIADQPLEKLEKLAIWNFDFDDFNDVEKEKLAKIKIPLRNLSLHYLISPFQNIENFSTFMNLFTESLIELDFGKVKPQPATEVYELIFQKFHKLKLLRVCLSSAPNDDDFYNKLPNNPAITKLIISKDKTIKFSKKAFFGFLSKLPNLDTMIVENDEMDREFFQFIAANCTNLKTLAVKRIPFSANVLKGVRMPNIETLIICNMKNMSVEDWKNFIRSFKNLKSLSIHESDEISLNDRTFNIFTKSLSKLTHLMFGAGFVAIKRVFNQMKTNCKNLQTVEMLKKSFNQTGLYERVLNDFKKPGLRFICYTDETKVCDRFDQSYGCNFWKTHAEFDVDIVDYEDNSDSDDDDSDNLFDSDDSYGGLEHFLRIIAHGPGGVPWYDSDTGEEQMGRFDSDGEWEPFDVEYYID